MPKQINQSLVTTAIAGQASATLKYVKELIPQSGTRQD